jgi:hypothetical protein
MKAFTYGGGFRVALNELSSVLIEMNSIAHSQCHEREEACSLSRLWRLNSMALETLQQKIARLEAENDALKSKGSKKLTFKVSEKGALSVYGMGRFPVTLYRQQWERLIEVIPELQAFIKANSDRLTTKE